MPVARRAARGRAAAAALLVVVAGWQVAQATLIPFLVTQDRFDVAASLAPDSALVSYLAGRDALGRGDLRGSNAAFRRSIARAPLNQSALTLLAIGEPARTAALMNQSAALGWRDLATQHWLAEAAGSDASLFALRFDAYARQASDGEQIVALLDQHIADPKVRAAMVERLALNPDWRSAYLGYLSRPEPALMQARLALLDGLRRAGSPAKQDEIKSYAGWLRHYGLETDARSLELTNHVAPETPK